MTSLHTHTLTRWLLLLAGWLCSTVTMGQRGTFCRPYSAAATLGSGSGVTTLSGGATYSGTYQVLGDLVLTNGTYTLTPGTAFYISGQGGKYQLVTGGYQRIVTGSTITVGTNATLVLDGATLTASGSSVNCPMWRGVVVNSNGQGPAGPYRLVVQNHSVISHAQCAISMADNTTAGATAYLLDQSTFSHNLTHVRDDAFYTGSQPSFITNCLFESDPQQMHFPYNQTTANDAYYTYEALVVRPRNGGNPGAFQAVEVRSNTITQAVYGIVNNQFDRAGVLIQNNFLNKILQTGIWTVNNDTNGGASTPVVSGNFVSINAYPSRDTDQVDPTATIFAILGEDTRLPNAFVGNTLAGDNNVGAKKPQVGLSIGRQTDASGNSMLNLTEGLRTADLDGSNIFDNRINDCDDAFVVQPSPNGLYYLNRLGCNTFSQSGAAPASRGIVVQQDATINDIGSFSNPAGNQFDGVGTSVWNDNNNISVTYYRTTSSQEVVTTGGLGSVFVNTIGRLNLNGYCANQGATNGVNTYRVTTPSASYIAAIMDSVRRQLVPAAQYRDYLYEVLDYHARAQQLPALETWWTTLAVTNAAAYRTVGRYLLRAYDAQPTTAGAAQRVLAALQPAALLNAELAAQLKLRAVLRHLPQTTPRLVAADSVTLRTLAWSGTSVAASAGRWLRYYHPRISLPAAVPALRTIAVRRKLALTESGAALSAPYPNPAQTEVTITCQLAQADQMAELRFTNLLTGKTALVVPVEGTGTERRQRVALAGLPAGQYAYQLVVDGQLIAAPQKIMVNP